MTTFDMYDLIESYASMLSYRIYVDIGVSTGNSSTALCRAAQRTGGKVYGIDFGYCKVEPPNQFPNYEFIPGESVTIGASWNYKRPDFVFIDTTHVKEWVMCELYFWWDLLNIDGVIAFHDTNWIIGRKDRWCGKDYDTVDAGIREFFAVKKLECKTNELVMSHYPFGDGLTFVRKKCEYDFKSKINNWDKVFSVRKEILECVIKYKNKASEYCDREGDIYRENVKVCINLKC